MKKTIVFLLATLLLTSCSGTPERNGTKTVLLIAKSGESTFWKTVFAGAKTAGTEYNVTIEIKYPDEEEDYKTQNEFLSAAIEEKVSAVVFSACNYDNSVAAAEEVMSSGIPVIGIDSGINTTRNMVFIGTDNVEAGRLACDAIMDLKDGKANVGIINFEENTGNGMQRQQGFLERLAESADMRLVDTRYCVSNVESPKSETINMLAQNPEINVIVTFNEWTTLGVASAVYEQGTWENYIIIGFDTNIESIKMLEMGVMDALIVQNPFAMGYLGVQYAINSIGKTPVKENINTGSVIITRDNMYNTENQKLMFPFTLEYNSEKENYLPSHE